MAKGRKKGASQKAVRLAAEAYRTRKTCLIRLLLVLALAVIIWAVYSFSPLNDHSMVNSVVTFGVAVVVVIVVGEFGVKYSNANTEYNKIKNEYGITDDMVKAIVKK